MESQPKPRAQHEWLQKLVGEWTFEHETSPGPDQAPVKFTGIERVRALGDLWVICEGEQNTPESCVGKTIMTLGYDPAKDRFVGTFIGTMMTNLWVYDGTFGPEQKSIVLDAEGPNFVEEGKTAKYQDVIEWIDDDNRLLRSSYLGDDGAWHEFMCAPYRRKR